MDTLQGNEAVQQFIELLEENGRQGQAADLSALMWYMDGMMRQYETVLQELQDVRQQLAQEQRPTVKEAMQDAVEKLENKVQQGRTALTGLWERIAGCAARAVEGFKEAGVSALDQAVSALGVKRALEALQENLSGAVKDAKNSIEKVERMGHELRSVGGHLKNAGRAMTGRETQAVDGGQEGRFQSVVLAPMRTVKKMLSSMNNATLAAIGGVENLEQTAETVREVRAERKAERKPSVRKDLEEKIGQTAAPAASAPDKDRRPHEAVL